MRLIDANIMAEDESEAYLKAQTSGKISPITQGINSVVHRKIQQLIADTPTIDPETLPIVQELRAELARVTAERDVAIKDMEALMWFSGEGCRICKHSVEIHKTPYVRTGCDLRPEKDCTPEWRGIQEVQKDE